jgi:hypothetical protein
MSRISPSRSVCAWQEGGRSEEKIRKKKKSGALVYRQSVGGESPGNHDSDES